MFLSSLMHAARSLRRWPVGAASSLLILTLGIGATTAIYSLVQAVLLNPLGYDRPESLAVLLDNGEFPVAPANYLDLKAQGRAYTQLEAAQSWGPSLTGAGPAERIPGLQTTPGMFQLLGVSPRLGRGFLPSEGAPGQDKVVILSDGFWQRVLAADPRAVGKSLRLNGESYTVIGVMPAGFEFPPFWATGAELWSPLDLSARTNDRAGRSLRLFARLAPGASPESAAAEISGLNNRLLTGYPDANQGLDLRFVPLHQKVTGKSRPMMFILMGAAGLILLIACANVAQLLLTWSTGRRRDTAVRLALGARPSDLLRAALAEGLVLSAAGAVLGVFAASWAVRAAVLLAPPDLPRIQSAAIDLPAIAFAVLAALLTGIFFGLAPALRQLRMDPQLAMREEASNVSEGATGRRARRLLVVSEVALGVVLTIGAALLVRSFVNLTHVDPGFDPRNLLTTTISVYNTGHAAEGRRLAFYDDVASRLRALPGVRSVSLVNHIPLGGDTWGARVSADGASPDRRVQSVYRVADHGYFSTMGITLREGREFTDRDTLNAPRIAVVNQALARQLWPGESAVGKRLTLDDPRKNPEWLTVAGVVSNVKQGEWAGESAAEVYLPLRQSASYLSGPGGHVSFISLTVRTTVPPESLASPLRAAIASADPEVPVSEILSMETFIHRQLARARFVTALVSLFGVIALLLAMAGIYGVVSYTVKCRTREIGIRMAMGADVAGVTRMVARQTLTLILPGIAIGLTAALLLHDLVRTLVYEISTLDPVSFVVAPAAFLATALVACWLPARRAARIDPLSALRQS